MGVVAESQTIDKYDRAMPSWLKYSLIGLIAIGVFFRFYNLDHKVYWIDETNSSLRTLGYTKTEMINTVFTGEVVTADQLQQFQRLSPDRGWSDTWHALLGTPEHTPLYFLLARAWIGVVGHSITSMRLLTALFSLLVFPCIYWLCRELFGSPTVGWMAMGLVAITPLHVLYAQEARPYSLLSVLILLSSALLLQAIRTQNRKTWIFYGLTVIAGLYTQLLFGLVAAAHCLYVLLTQGWRSPAAKACLLAVGTGLLSFMPWLMLILSNWQEVQASTTSLTDSYSSSGFFSYLINRWFLNLNLGLISRELGAANILLVIATIAALYLLVRQSPKRTWMFVLLLIGIPFLALALPDLIVGGRRSLRIRYLFPCFLGIQLAFAYVLATQAIWVKTWPQYFWRFLGIALIAASIVVCGISSQAVVWWNKSVPRSSYYPPVAAIVNQAANPIILSDGPVTDNLAFSTWLKPDVRLQLTDEQPRQLKIESEYDPIYLLNPTKQLQKIMTRRGYQLEAIYEDRSDPSEIEQRLWIAKK